MDFEASADPAFNRGDLASCKQRVAGLEAQIKNAPHDCADARVSCVTIGEVGVIGEVDVGG